MRQNHKMVFFGAPRKEKPKDKPMKRMTTRLLTGLIFICLMGMTVSAVIESGYIKGNQKGAVPITGVLDNKITIISVPAGLESTPLHKASSFALPTGMVVTNDGVNHTYVYRLDNTLPSGQANAWISFAWDNTWFGITTDPLYGFTYGVVGWQYNGGTASPIPNTFGRAVTSSDKFELAPTNYASITFYYKAVVDMIPPTIPPMVNITITVWQTGT